MDNNDDDDDREGDSDYDESRTCDIGLDSGESQLDMCILLSNMVMVSYGLHIWKVAFKVLFCNKNKLASSKLR